MGGKCLKSFDKTISKASQHFGADKKGVKTIHLLNEKNWNRMQSVWHCSNWNFSLSGAVQKVSNIR